LLHDYTNAFNFFKSSASSVGAVNNGTTAEFLLLGAVLTGVAEPEFGLDVLG